MTGTATPATPETASTPAPRDTSVDALKGFAILCVVLGHAIQRNLPGFNDNPVFQLLGAFEMPLFVFLSGYVLAGRVRSPRLLWTLRRAVRLLVPFFAWTAILWLARDLPVQGLRPFIDTSRSLPEFLWHAVTNPSEGLWYLPVIFLMSAVLAAALPLTKRHMPLLVLFGWILPSAVLAQGRALTDPTYDFGLLKTVSYWPYFIEAYATAAAGTLLAFDKPRRWAWLALFPAFGLLLVREAHRAVAINQILLWLAGFGGIAFSVWLVQQLAKSRAHDVLARLGNLTLGIYCAHFLFLRPLTPLGITQGWGAVAAGFVTALAASIGITLLIRRVPVLPGILLGEWKRRSA